MSHVTLSWVFVCSRRGRFPKMSPGLGDHLQVPREPLQEDGLTLASLNVQGFSYERFTGQKGPRQYVMCVCLFTARKSQKRSPGSGNYSRTHRQPLTLWVTTASKSLLICAHDAVYRSMERQITQQRQTKKCVCVCE